MTYNNAMLVNKKTLRHLRHSVVDCYRATSVQHIRIVDAILLHKGQGITTCVLEIDTEEDHILLADLRMLPGGFQQRRFLITGDAPRRPDVKHHCLALEVAEGDRGLRSEE